MMAEASSAAALSGKQVYLDHWLRLFDNLSHESGKIVTRLGNADRVFAAIPA